MALQLELLPSPFAQVYSNLENQQACNHWMGRPCLGLLKKKSHPRALSLFDLSSSSLEKPCSQGIVVIWPDGSSELTLQENPIPRTFVKNSQWQLILSCWGGNTSCENKNLAKNLKGTYGNKISVKGFEKLWHIPRELEHCAHMQGCVHT